MTMSARLRSNLSCLTALSLTAIFFIPSARASETVTYTYDARGQVVQAIHSGAVNNGVATCYDYDKADNRTSVNVTNTSACAAPAPPSFSVSDATVTEGGSIIFTVTKTGSTSSTISLSYASANGTAIVGSDYALASGTLSFAAGDANKTVSVTTTNDSVIERAETVKLNLSNVSPGGVIADSEGIGTIADNEGFSISDTSVTEAQQIQFTVTKTGTTTANIVLGFSTQDGTGTAGSDYIYKAGTIVFAPTTTSQSINIGGLSDTAPEANETVLVNLFNPSDGSILDGQGVGTINDDDIPVSFSVSDVTAAEGGSLTFTVVKSGLTSSSFNVNYATASGTATASSDFGGLSGTLTFASNVSSLTRTVTTTEDVAFEGTEQFTFTLSSPTGGATLSDGTAVGTITDNDTVASGPSFSINDASAGEGGVLTFTVTKTGSTSSTTSVNFATQTGSASAGDYTATSGTLTFTSAQTSKQVTVQTNDNQVNEANETMKVVLSSATGANISDSIGVGTIVDDDGDPCPLCR